MVGESGKSPWYLRGWRLWILQNFEFPHPFPSNSTQCREFSPAQGQRSQFIPLYSSTYSPGWPGVLPQGQGDDMCITFQKRPKTDKWSSRRETALPQCLMYKQANTTFTDTYQLRHLHLYNNFFLSRFPRVQEDPREPMTRWSYKEYLHVSPHFRYSQKHLAGNCSQTDFLCIVKKFSSFQLQGHLHWRTNSESLSGGYIWIICIELNGQPHKLPESNGLPINLMCASKFDVFSNPFKVAPYSFLTARELVSKSRDGASFKKST